MALTNIAAPALVLIALTLSAAPAGAQRRQAGQPADHGSDSLCRLSRTCWPGPFVTVYPGVSSPRAKSIGLLHLHVEPSSAEVYIDNVYAGTVLDFNGTSPRAALSAGSHLIEVRTAGRASLWFDARIEKNRTTVHHGTLPPAR